MLASLEPPRKAEEAGARRESGFAAADPSIAAASLSSDARVRGNGALPSIGKLCSTTAKIVVDDFARSR
jgi:hypothetical protein